MLVIQVIFIFYTLQKRIEKKEEFYLLKSLGGKKLFKPGQK